MLDDSPDLEHALQKVATIAQMVLLAPRTAATAAAAAASSSSSSEGLVGQAGPVLVINTHLFFHPYAPHIRTLHTAAILEEAAAALQQWNQQQQQQQQQQQGGGEGGQSSSPSPSTAAAAGQGAAGYKVLDPELLQQLAVLPPPTVLFCGDLNSDLNDGVPGVIELLQTGQLSADHWDWKMGASFKWGKGEGEYAEEEQQQQEQQQQLADGHDFDPPADSPTKVLQVYGRDVKVPFVLRR